MYWETFDRIQYSLQSKALAVGLGIYSCEYSTNIVTN